MQRRLTSTDGMLLLTVVLWALGIVVTKYLLDNGFQPLAYSAVRYGLATAIFLVLTYALERSLRVGGRAQLGQIAIAAFALLLNQVCFVYALKLTTATTVALMLGTMPVFAGLFGSLAGVERMTRRFSLAAGVSFCGVGLVAAGSGGDFSGHLAGILVAVGIAATWAAYSVAIAPLMRSYSPYRISSVVLAVMWVPLVIIASPQIADQDLRPRLEGMGELRVRRGRAAPAHERPLVHGRPSRRAGDERRSLRTSSRSSRAVFAVILLSEPLSAWQIGGGVLIGAGIFLAGRRETVAAPAE